MQGDGERECLEAQRWSGKQTSCQRKCSSVEKVVLLGEFRNQFLQTNFLANNIFLDSKFTRIFTLESNFSYSL